jgi:hypothetical protein
MAAPQQICDRWFLSLHGRVVPAEPPWVVSVTAVTVGQGYIYLQLSHDDLPECSMLVRVTPGLDTESVLRRLGRMRLAPDLARPVLLDLTHAGQD